GSIGPVPMPFVLLIIVGIITYVLLHHSVFGRYLYAVGRNEDAARYSGINSRLIIMSAYIVEMLLVALAGILIAFYTNSISPANHGATYELYAIAAAVLGGCSLRGGEGSIIGIIIGTALLQVLQNLVNLLGIPSSLNFAVMGAVILIGVMADQWFQSRQPGKLAWNLAGGGVLAVLGGGAVAAVVAADRVEHRVVAIGELTERDVALLGFARGVPD